jgi:HEAT repeat protein
MDPDIDTEIPGEAVPQATGTPEGPSDGEPNPETNPAGKGEGSAPSELADQELAEGLDALGAAFTTYQLYPNPLEHDVFVRSVERLASLQALPLHAEVGPKAFMNGSDLVETSREGVDRLVQRLFIHDVSALQIEGPPTPEEVDLVFGVLAREQDDVRSSGGVVALVSFLGIESIKLIQRTMLVESESATAADRRDPELANLLEEAADPARFAENLLANAGEDREELRDRFSKWYSDVYARVADEDVAGREELVRVFVEAFFYLPEKFQVPIIEHFLLTRREVPAFEVFLDQFSGHELAGFAPDLGEVPAEALVQYARVSSDTADERPEELLALLQSAVEVKEARQAVASRVGELLNVDGAEAAVKGESFQSLTEQIPSADGGSDLGRRVLRELMYVEDRDVRFRRLLRIWSGKVAAAVRQGDLLGARSWLEALLDEPTYAPSRDGEVREALGAMANPDLIESLVHHLGDPDKTEAGAKLLEAWGTPVLDKLVEHLADEDDPSRRRILIELLVKVSAQDHSPLLRHLNDERWYVVRNLATILGRTGKADSAQKLVALAAKHSDHRVRVEALRSLARLPGTPGTQAALDALADKNQRVRQAALTLLRSSEDPSTDEYLAAALVDAARPVETRLRVVDILGERQTPAARKGLEELAGKRFAFFGKDNVLRNAARKALGEEVA